MVRHYLRCGQRFILRDPAFALIAIVTLAVGIGANTAIFAVLDRLVIRAIAFPDPDRLVVVWETNPTLALPVMVASAPTLHDWQTRNRSFEAIGAFRWRSMTLSGTGDPEQIPGAAMTAALARTLAVQPQLGRLFSDEDDRPEAPPVTLISDELWRRRFVASPSVLGQRLLLDGVAREIIGVMPPAYHAPPPVVFRGQPPADRAEVWIPLAIDPAAGQRAAHNLTVIARLRRGVTPEMADRDIKGIAAEVAREDPGSRDWSARVVSLAGWVTASSRRSMALMTGAVGFLLVLACANVANLLLARGVGRRRDFAILAALGATRQTLVTQVIVESLALAVLGGMAGVALASGLIRLMVAVGPDTIPGLREAALDLRALGYALAISAVSAALAAVLPACRAMTTSPTDWLRDRGAGRGPIRVQKALVIAQIALAIALLLNASLLAESFRRLRAVDPGFEPEHVVTGRVVFPLPRYPDGTARAVFVDRLLSSVQGLPDVPAIGVSDAVPIADNRQGTFFRRADAAGTPEVTANFAYVTDGYFEALGTRILEGRAFSERSGRAGPGVLVINERLARDQFGDESPLGRFAKVGAVAQGPLEIVGVVADDRHVAVDTAPTPTFFLSYRHMPDQREIAVIARATGDPASIVNVLRSAIHALDPEMPFYRVRTMQQIVETSVATPRSMAWSLSGFAVSGLLLAAIGVFGLASHGVSQRTREIGIRMAVGATALNVVRMILGEALVQVGAGILIGAVIALATTRLISGLLFGVTTASITPYIAVAALVAIVTIAACLAPVRRAVRIDPVTALRTE